MCVFASVLSSVIMDVNRPIVSPSVLNKDPYFLSTIKKGVFSVGVAWQLNGRCVEDCLPSSSGRIEV